jgi:hypothetical protein
MSVTTELRNSHSLLPQYVRVPDMGFYENSNCDTFQIMYVVALSRYHLLLLYFYLKTKPLGLKVGIKIVIKANPKSSQEQRSQRLLNPQSNLMVQH